MKKTLFQNVIFKGLMGAMIGVIGGLILGIFIALIRELISIIDISSQDYGPRLADIAFLGMCFGTIIGSVFGSIAGLKEQK